MPDVESRVSVMHVQEGKIEKLFDRACNALIRDAEADLSATTRSDTMGRVKVEVAPKGVAAAAKRVSEVKRMSDGLWVGGRIVLYRDYLEFRPNKTNERLHSNLSSVRINLSTIRNVMVRRRFLTGIVSVATEEGDFEFRCWKAREACSQIRSCLETLENV